MILGFVCCCRFYLSRHSAEGALIIARRCMQDIVEHHFGHLRQSVGSHSNPLSIEAGRGTCVAGVMRLSEGGTGNSAHAPNSQSGQLVLPMLPRGAGGKKRKRREE